MALMIAGPGLLKADEVQPGVARVSFIRGDVSVQRGDSGDWVATTLNAPIAVGDQISTGPGSRAELELDYANVLRLSERSQAKIADLSRDRIQVQVANGLLDYSVLKGGGEAEAEIDTPNVAIRPLGAGRYRIEVTGGSETELTVREGQAEVSTPQGSTTVNKNETVHVRGVDNPEYQITAAIRRDEWDTWNQDRDKTVTEARSWDYTNRYYTGSEDLDRYGHWESVPGYDQVWVPYEPPGWVPYSDGRWVWEPYYGWTWVAYEPWGWAPYHYGRWFYWGSSWCWWPGPVYPAYYPIWAPAYVSFFGFGFGSGFHFGLGFGFGSIGWLPLGPFDPFFPWFGFGFGFRPAFNVVNIRNITNITNITNINNFGTMHTRVIPGLASGTGRPFISNFQSALNNANVRRAITTIPTNDFGKGMVTRARQPVTPAMLKQGQLVAGNPPVVPTRASLQPSSRAASPAAVPRQTASPAHFFTKQQPPAGPRPFTEQAAQVQRMIQDSKPETLVAQNEKPSAPAGARPAGSNQAGGAASNGQAATRSQAQPSSGQAHATGDSGWQRFGSANASPGSGFVSRAANTASRDRGQAAQPNSFHGSNSTAPDAARTASGGGWWKFSSGGETHPVPRASQRNGQSNGNTAPAGASRATARPQSAPESAPTHSGWDSFSGGGHPTGRPPAAAPGTSGAEPGHGRPSVAPSDPQGGGNWQRFNGRAARPESPQPSGRAFDGLNAGSAERPGWDRFIPGAEPASRRGGESFSRNAPDLGRNAPSGSGGWGYGGPARGYGSERPPLQLNHPVVEPRAPSGFGGGGYQGGRSGGYQGSSGGGYHGSSGGGGHASAPASHGGGGHR